jgi:type II secretory pathway predicted ATPase ExeA
MYENYYGFAEKPFSLTPDPKFLYRSPSHGDAFDLLQYAIRRREGFVVVTGDIGTGKTTVCRALLEQIERTTFTALVLNPFLSEEELLKRILVDFGIVSREEIKARLTGVTKQELIDTLYDFLLGLIPLNASAVLIIDEAQNLPLAVLEQVRILSNLETDKEKLLQIILVGQLDLVTLLRSRPLRQLDQRVSIRYQLKPLDREAAGAYVAHRLTVAGGSGSVTFTARALDHVHRLSGGIPRLINLICDRALLAGFSQQSSRITPEMVIHAAEGLDVQVPGLARLDRRLRGRVSLAAAAATVLFSSILGVGGSAYVYQRFADTPVQAAAPSGARHADRRAETVRSRIHTLPPETALTVLVGAFPTADPGTEEAVQTLTDWLETFGVPVYYVDVAEAGGHWQRVLAGAYTEAESARRDADRLNAASPALHARVVGADEARRSGARR